MARKNAIIRRLSAVETLGSSSIICSDKTGTLTQNKMQIVEIYGDTAFTLELGTMCTDTEIGSHGEVIGDPTENAIVNKALEYGINKNMLYDKMERVGEIPFESERKLMTTIHKLGNKYRIITKGAVDNLLNKCNKICKNGEIRNMEEMDRRNIFDKNLNMADKALRVLAVAYLDVDRIDKMTDEEIEQNLIFTGLVGMIDPPRDGVKEAIATCKKAGIKTVMITGDHIATAKAIAKDLGILTNNSLAITGKELDKIPQNILERDIMKYSVFARVSPEHKVRIVNAFKQTGKTVAMTGDGVNDAPALKKADIGISMGLNRN